MCVHGYWNNSDHLMGVKMVRGLLEAVRCVLFVVNTCLFTAVNNWIVAERGQYMEGLMME